MHCETTNCFDRGRSDTELFSARPGQRSVDLWALGHSERAAAGCRCEGSSRHGFHVARTASIEQWNKPMNMVNKVVKKLIISDYGYKFWLRMVVILMSFVSFSRTKRWTVSSCKLLQMFSQIWFCIAALTRTKTKLTRPQDWPTLLGVSPPLPRERRNALGNEWTWWVKSLMSWNLRLIL